VADTTGLGAPLNVTARKNKRRRGGEPGNRLAVFYPRNRRQHHIPPAPLESSTLLSARQSS
jgi:hypothetical protein